MTMNVFTCTTRLYKDAEQKFLADGTGIVSFTGAVDAGFGKNKTTSWIKFSLFGKRGDALFPYLKDKTQVCVSGELANRKWQDKDGQDRYTTEIRVDSVQPLGPRPDGVGGSASNDRAGQGKGNEAPPAGGFPEGADDDLPY